MDWKALKEKLYVVYEPTKPDPLNLNAIFEAKYGKGKRETAIPQGWKPSTLTELITGVPKQPMKATGVPTAREEALVDKGIGPLEIPVAFVAGGLPTLGRLGLAGALKTGASWAAANIPYEAAQAVDMPWWAALGVGLATPAGIQIGAGKLAGRLAQRGAGIAKPPKRTVSSLGKKLTEYQSSIQKPTIEGLVRQKGGVPARVMEPALDVEYQVSQNLLKGGKEPLALKPFKGPGDLGSSGKVYQMPGQRTFNMPGEIGKPPGELSATVKNVLEETYAGGKKLTGQDLANALEKVQRKTALRKAVEKMFGKEVKKSPVSKTREVAKTVPSEGGRLIGNIPITESKEVIPYLYSTTRDMQAIDTGATKVVAGQTWRHVKYVKSPKLEAQLKKEWPEDLGKLKEPLYSEWVPDFTLKRGK